MWNRQTHIKSLSTVQSCLCQKWSCARTWEIWTDLRSRCNCQKISDLHPFEPVPVFGHSCPSIWLLCHLCTHCCHQIHRHNRGMFLLHLHCDWLQEKCKIWTFSKIQSVSRNCTDLTSALWFTSKGWYPGYTPHSWQQIWTITKTGRKSTFWPQFEFKVTEW